MNSKSFLFAGMVCALMVFPQQAISQGSLNPPGPPAQTMKTLDQVQPRTPVDATHTPGDALSLFKIASSGSYYLTGNITGVSNLHGILIAAPNVTLDLNGFSLTGVPGSLDGINATNTAPSSPGLVVRNGTVGGWGGNGINAQFGAPGARFSALLLLTNGLSGLRAVGAVITDCVAQGNTAGGSSTYGIHAVNSRVVNCVAKANVNGIQGSGGCVIEGCVAGDNAFGFLGDNSMVLQCTAYNNSVGGMFLFNNNRIVGNLVDGNSHGSGIVLAGSSVANVIDGNTLISNPTAGIVLNNSGVANNFVIRNTARGAGANNYLTGTNSNAFGPIVNTAGTNDISAVSNANHPWANFSY